MQSAEFADTRAQWQAAKAVFSQKSAGRFRLGVEWESFPRPWPRIDT
jgi:hypothetical protein